MNRYWLITRRIFVLVFVVISVFVPVSVQAAATKSNASSAAGSQTSGANISQAVAQSYNADSSVQLGMIVGVSPKDAGSVIPLSVSGGGSILGVVVTPSDAAVTLSPQTGSRQQVFVATSGRYNVLVSTQNGPVTPGSYIALSALSGVGMHADATAPIVVGKAVSQFSGTTNVLGTDSLKNSAGQQVKVSLGEVQVDINVTHNPLASKQTDYVPSFLSKAAVSVATHPVSAARIYLGIITLFACTVLSANLLFSGVRSGMQAIGRNPLSRKSIIRSLIQTVIAGLIIFVVGVFAVYLLLKL